VGRVKKKQYGVCKWPYSINIWLGSLDFSKVLLDPLEVDLEFKLLRNILSCYMCKFRPIKISV